MQFKKEWFRTVKYFVGINVEQTPAYGKKTLYVVGLALINKIKDRVAVDNIKYIHLGANRSFTNLQKNNNDYIIPGILHGDKSTKGSEWNSLIKTLINDGFTVTLEYLANEHASVLEIISSDIWESNKFIPVLTVQIPHLANCNPNLTLKIDDIGFDETNPGVWCHNCKDATDNNKFTRWDEYEIDEYTPIAQLLNNLNISNIHEHQDITPVDLPNLIGSDTNTDTVDIINDMSTVHDLSDSDQVDNLDNPIKEKGVRKKFISKETVAKAYAEGVNSDALSPKKARPTEV